MTKISRWISLLLSLVMLLSVVPFPQVYAEGTGNSQMAQDISGLSLVTSQSGIGKIGLLFDGDQLSLVNSGRSASMTLEYEGGIGSLYLIFALEHGAYTVTNNDTGETHTWGENNFIHEFLDLEGTFGAAPKSVTIQFNENELYLNEVKAFTSGQVPDYVQKWDVAKENEVDLILFSTHGDDEQLFFAGLLPYYAKERDYEVLVVYMTNHRNHTTLRVHEMLNGLWAVGVTKYPVLGTFPDFFVNYLSGAYSIFAQKGITEEDITQYVVENIRRYKPKVAVGHDPLGEYSHGQHMVYSEVLQKAVHRSMDPAYFPESAEKYGVWDVPKTYLHLYTENQIVMDWDQPLESFGGMTAFEVTKHIGFQCHVSQITDFSWYLAQGSTAAEFQKYSPSEYGLFRSTVGEDVQKNDFFENVLTHEEDRIKAEEERLEAERKAEEEARKQAEAEAAARQEAERKALEEKQRQEAETAAREAAARKQRTILTVCCAAIVVASILLVVIIVLLKKRRY